MVTHHPYITYILPIRPFIHQMAFIQKRMAVHVTKEAAHQLSLRGSSFLFSCKSGGCNGFEYILEQAEENTSNVELQKLENGVDLMICNISMLHLLGTRIDWSDSLMGARFVFTNPNAQSVCGCGSTFST